VRFPAAAPRLRKLAERAVGDLDEPAGRAAALAIFVHHHLRYRDAVGARTVWDTLAERAGDCTEFADLYATLARAVGLPARTVVGLAYHRDGFALHAWNEVAVDGAWRGVDPTWGRTSLGAVHLPLPEGLALDVIAELPRLRLRVLEAEYDEA
jgi:transglutaminase-like putative cysteine protease